MENSALKSTSIAIIGMSCRFAGDATNPEEFWKMLVEGRSAWSEIPLSRFNIDGVYHPSHENISTVGANLRDHGWIEYTYKGDECRQICGESREPLYVTIYGKNADGKKTLDPQYRLQLESVYEALENAGIPLTKVAGSATSVFAGAFFHDYHDSHMRDPESLPRFLMTGNGAAMASNRISHFYDLLGPSMTLDTGCSTTLTALHQACQSLKAGEADMSIVSGSNIMINPDIFITMGSLGLLSPDGKSYSFDSRANGYGRGEGVATVVLKRLDDALKAGDPVRAVIRETQVNQDGKTETITSPSQQAQEQLIRSCYRKAGVHPRAVQYFEAHGTGTPTGDPVEVGAIASIFQQGRSAQNPLYIGSVKTNIGHTETTSGLASVIKVVLALERGIIPPSINFESPNKSLSLDEWNLKVPTKCEEWLAGIPRASVNNFGYGGTNAHVIMEGWKSRTSVNKNELENEAQITDRNKSHQSFGSRVFILSAKDEQVCQAMTANLKEYLQGLPLCNQEEFLDDLAYTLGQRRTLFPWIWACAAGSVSSLIGELDSLKIKPSRAANQPRIGFIFTGQGAQWHAMGRELIDSYPVFKASILEAEKYLAEFGCDWSIHTELLRDVKTSRVNETLVSTPLCVAIQVSLVRLLESWGVTPVGVSSHSSGEIAAAYAAGALSYRSAMAVSYCRGEVTSASTSGRGGMLAIGMGRDSAESLLKRVNSGKANVACINSPSSVTVSGDLNAIEELEGLAKELGVFVRRLRINAAFHSHFMEQLAQPYLEQMLLMGVGKDKRKMKPVRFGSPTTGTLMTSSADIGSPDHWVKSMLNPVLFIDSFREMALDSSTGSTAVDLVIEIGPHAALSGPVGDIFTLPEFKDSDISYLSCLVRKSSALVTMHTLATQLISKGFPVDLSSVNLPRGKHNAAVLYDLPPYPWNHQFRHWSEPLVNKRHRERQFAPHDLLGSLQTGTDISAPTWRHIIRASELAWVRHHSVQSNMVYPGAGYICMAIEAMCQVSRMSDKMLSGYQFRDVVIQQALVIPEGPDGVEVLFTLKDVSEKAIGVRDWKEFQILSIAQDSKRTEHCRGLVHAVLEGSTEDQGRWDFPGPLFETRAFNSHLKEIDPEDLFSGLRCIGICHGPVFQNIERIKAGERLSVTTLSVADVQSIMPAHYQHNHVLHPTTLDSVFVSAYTALTEADFAQSSAKVPKTIKSLWVANNIISEAGHRFKAYSEIKRADSKGFRSRVFLVDASHDVETPVPLVVVDGLVCQSLGSTISHQPEPYQDEICSTLKWRPDICLLEPSQLKQSLRLPISQTEADILLDLKHACFHFVHDALGSLTPSDVQQLGLHQKKFYVWMKHLDSEVLRGHVDPGCLTWIEESSEEKQRLFKEVAAASVNGEMVCRVGPQIAAILRHQLSPLELMMEDKLLYKYYRDSLKFDRSYNQLSELVNHVVHKNPQAKILEIGAGTGGATRWVLNVLGNGKKSGHGPLSSAYHFTDLSSGFFEAAQENFADWSDIISYRKLDIETDPVKQGFESGSYDLVIACQVLHATKSMAKTMTNVRTLLKPGGKVILFETTQDQLDIQFVFGLLPGWWLGEEEERYLSPNLSVPLWDRVLKVTGFSGIDVNVHDCESEELYSFSVMMSTAQSERQNSLLGPVVLVSDTIAREQTWMKMLQESVAATTGECAPAAELLHSVDANGKICVFVEDIYRPLLSKPSPSEFEAIKTLALNCRGLLWVTRGGAVECESPMLALSHGFLRSLRNEHSGKKYISLDLDLARPRLDQQDAAIITRVLAASFDVTDSEASQDFEFAEREGVILIPRLHKDFERNQFIAGNGTQTMPPSLEPFKQSNRPLKLQISTTGLLETLTFTDHLDVYEDIDHEDIEVEPKSFGVNFRDVMVAMGQLDETRMGFECAGVITRVGTNAALNGYNVGDRVFCLLDGQYASRVRLPWTTAYHMPPDMTFELAASIPMVFATAHISLHDIARLSKGQSILIHAATGGVGQAAIILSQLVGAEVFATAGTVEKRDFIIQKYGIPENHVFSSRDTSFAAKLMSVTNGLGVDVILNSLSGRLLQESFNCLAPFGHFVEIGKYDLEQNSYLEMEPFTRVVSFTSVDLSVLLRHKPSEIHRTLAKVASLFQQKLIRAVEPVTFFPLCDVEKAFRHMQAGKHTGKIVVSVGREDIVPVVPRRPPTRLRSDSSYIIVGGVGGIGRSIAQWMLGHGAKSLILLSRSANAEGEMASFVAELQERHPGSRIKAVGCDISNATELSLALRNCSREVPTIRGIVQGAMVLRDSILEHMTIDSYMAAVRPKVYGTWNLHKQLGSQLDFFIMLSSLAGILGYSSQSNYTAGGAFQDALARYRVSKGLPAVAIDLGVVKSVGYVATHKSVHERLKRIGHTALSEDQVLRALESAILNPSPQVMVGLNTGPGPQWDEETGSPLARESRFLSLRYREPSKATGASTTLRRVDNLAGKLASASSLDESAGLIMRELSKKLGDIFMIPVDEITPSKSMASFGVDSLVAVELRNMLILQAGSDVSIFEIMQSPSLTILSHTVASKSAHVALPLRP
ncbi:uncharacterized protein LDX57_007859 [Aspergillus melleus]|uniref:uncharacterized protein n=1 Tax=Aspergillus melleus TaxID=138277 RepID=UPI001E8CE6D7|nr:uncharacterized protein LDX57_007859 [Aspergillus melleus]KAH8430189.1 hypothetical protein LDX57_007859 [Aspergillus melleus]